MPITFKETPSKKTPTKPQSKKSKHPDYAVKCWNIIQRNFFLRSRYTRSIKEGTPMWETVVLLNTYLKGFTSDQIIETYYLKNPDIKIKDEIKKTEKLKKQQKKAAQAQKLKEMEKRSK